MMTNDPKVLAAMSPDENAHRGLATWTVVPANRAWTGAEWQVLLPRGGWWPAAGATDVSDAELRAKAFWDGLTEADLVADAEVMPTTQDLASLLVAFGAANPGVVIDVSGPWPDWHGEDPKWIATVKFEDRNWDEMFSGGRDVTPEGSVDQAMRLFAEFSRRYDLGDNVWGDRKVQAEIRVAAGVPG